MGELYTAKSHAEPQTLRFCKPDKATAGKFVTMGNSVTTHTAERRFSDGDFYSGVPSGVSESVALGASPALGRR